ncbi:MAG: hypothetical protein GY761_01195 [Hyphomicrobiales bacterium]|nr:hypothetical protein [Hyphomicrobiales bacterium]
MTSNLIDKSPTVIGLIAAAVFCAMVVIFSSMGLLVLVPVFLGALPVYVAALGWGTRAGIVATAAIIAVSAILSNPTGGFLIGVMIAAPAALAGHQANLAQSADTHNDELQWYPFSQILFWITLLIIGAVLLFGILIDFDPAEISAQLSKHLKLLLPTPEVGSGLSVEDRDKALLMNLQMMPFVLPSLWIGIHFLNFLLALKITRQLDVLARPVEDIAAVINLPSIALVLLVVSISGIVITSPPYSRGFAVAAGALMMAFSIVGLAVMHQRIRHWPIRSLMLFMTYAMIAMIFLPVYLFSFAGILRVAGMTNEKREPNSNE